MRCMGISGVLTAGVLTAGVLTAGVLTAGVDSCLIVILTCIGYSLFSLVMRIVILPIRNSYFSFFQSYSG
jgi:hypothetical protein